MLIHSLSTSVSNLFLDLDFSDPRYQNELLAIEKRNFSYNSIVIDRSRRIRINFLLHSRDIREYRVDFSSIMPTFMPSFIEIFSLFKITKAFRTIKIFSRRADLFLGYVAILLSIEFLYHTTVSSSIKQMKYILYIEIPRAFQSSFPTK